MANDEFERISALTDGELSGPDLKNALDALDESELRGRWTRYHLVSDVLRKNFVGAYPNDLADRVSRAVAREETLRLKPLRMVRVPPAIWHQAAGVAVAASVTAVAILGFQNMQEQGAPATAAGVQVVADQDSNTNSGTHVTHTPDLDSYLVNHNEVAGATGFQGVLPYVRLVGHR